MNKFNYILAMAILIGTTASCGLFKTTKTENYEPEPEVQLPATSQITKSDAEKLIVGEWTIYTVNGKKVTGENRPYITFNDADHRIYGSNGCNIINGDYSVGDNSSLTISNVISTMMACPDAPFEMSINQAIDQARHFKIQKSGHESYLDVLDKSGKTMMVLRRHNMDFLNGTWKIAEINGKENTNPDVEMVIDIQEHKIHGNAGCNIINGSLLIDPDKSNSIQFQDIASTRMMCPDMKTETAFLVALESVEYAKKGKHGKVIMFDKDNNQVLILEKENVQNN